MSSSLGQHFTPRSPSTVDVVLGALQTNPDQNIEQLLKTIHDKLCTERIAGEDALHDVTHLLGGYTPRSTVENIVQNPPFKHQDSAFL